MEKRILSNWKKELLHGADYNPDQWIGRDDILEEDIRLMKKAGINEATLGVFSWASLEPYEGVYTFEWLDKAMDRLYKNGIRVILATPSGGKPPWLVKKYPEVMRTKADRVRLLYGERENQCNSSTIYRDKVRGIDAKLAKRYSHHPALYMWHISNEMYGECHCASCQRAFQAWLQNKYETIEKLNEQYWSSFWSHSYTSFEEIESPSPNGETAVHGLELDYKRFYSELSVDFLRMEIDTVRAYNPEIPVTTNTFHFNCGMDPKRIADVIDVASWDSYPRWHCGEKKETEWQQGIEAAFSFDYCRSMKKAPFLLMESTPSTTNGFPVSKLKRPGMHMLSSMQAIAQGSDSVQYFQWRQGLGAYEKFHGAVLTHNGSDNTRVFHDVEEVGVKLKEWSMLQGSVVSAKVALLYDWENMRALEEQKNLRRPEKDFERIIREHYEALKKNYVSVDIIDERAELSSYELVIAPSLYLYHNEIENKIRNYVAQGGTIVMTYYSGLVNENDLAYEAYPPYGLQDVFGIKVEETDSLCDGDSNSFLYKGIRYQGGFYCDLVLPEATANVISTYEQDFYKGMPVLTKNIYQRGTAYYISCRTENDFLQRFYGDLVKEHPIRRITKQDYVEDVMFSERITGEKRFVFAMNFATGERVIQAPDGSLYPMKGYEIHMWEDKRNEA